MYSDKICYDCGNSFTPSPLTGIITKYVPSGRERVGETCESCTPLQGTWTGGVDLASDPDEAEVHIVSGELKTDGRLITDAGMLYVSIIMSEAISKTQQAMLEYPQPNYVLLKVAEEAGEVVRAGVHLSEGRDCTFRDLEKECTQTIAMCLRLLLEGDETIGLKVPKRGGIERGGRK